MSLTVSYKSLKITASTKNQLLDVVVELSSDIGMHFGFDNWCVLNIIKWQIQSGDYSMKSGQNIEEMDIEEIYHNLDMKQVMIINHHIIKRDLVTKFNKE